MKNTLFRYLLQAAAQRKPRSGSTFATTGSAPGITNMKSQRHREVLVHGVVCA
jgi:hypothetical protein